MQLWKTTPGSSLGRNRMLHWAQTHHLMRVIPKMITDWIELMIDFCLSSIYGLSWQSSSTSLSLIPHFFNWDSVWICIPKFPPPRCHYTTKWKSFHTPSLPASTRANASFISFIFVHSITQPLLMCLISETVTQATVGEAKHLRKLDPFQWRIRWGEGEEGWKRAEGLLVEYKFTRTSCEIYPPPAPSCTIHWPPKSHVASIVAESMLVILGSEAMDTVSSSINECSKMREWKPGASQGHVTSVLLCISFLWCISIRNFSSKNKK